MSEEENPMFEIIIKGYSEYVELIGNTVMDWLKGADPNLCMQKLAEFQEDRDAVSEEDMQELERLNIVDTPYDRKTVVGLLSEREPGETK